MMVYKLHRFRISALINKILLFFQTSTEVEETSSRKRREVVVEDVTFMSHEKVYDEIIFIAFYLLA